MNETTGKKEVAEAVIIAGLSALASALVTWGVESLKAASEQKAAERKKAKKKCNG